MTAHEQRSLFSTAPATRPIAAPSAGRERATLQHLLRGHWTIAEVTIDYPITKTRSVWRRVSDGYGDQFELVSETSAVSTASSNP
jgi:hypothetical protein